jgi:tryptophanyl-tRNA synthetase
MMKTILTGVKSTGVPHLGNYLGAIRPSLKLIKNSQAHNFMFIADYHSLNSIKDPAAMRYATLDVAATYLACGLDPEQVVMYQQSHVPQIMELCWILTCFIPKGDLNRAHAYKAARQQNADFGREDLDHGINGGLFMYPVLMSADILGFDTNFVPVGQDQRQHIEIARSIAQRINQHYKKDLLVEPKEIIEEHQAVVVGLDGRKMSKSYDNSIPMFVPEKKLKKLMNQIKTDSAGPSEPKEWKSAPVFHLYQSFVGAGEVANEFAQELSQGLSWGAAKEKLFQVVNDELKEPREKYTELMSKPKLIDEILAHGAVKARTRAAATLARVKEAMLGVSLL